MVDETLPPAVLAAKSKSKRTAIYTRVSTGDQRIETQLYDLREMAKFRGYEIVGEYSDQISGAKSKRPGLDKLMTDAHRNRFDVVLVWAFDRMARSVRHFLEILDVLPGPLAPITAAGARTLIGTSLGPRSGPGLFYERYTKWF